MLEKYILLLDILAKVNEIVGRPHIVWKLLKMSHLNILILAFSTNFCDLAGSIVWPQASGFQIDIFWLF